MSQAAPVPVPLVSGTWKSLKTMRLAFAAARVPPIFEKT